MKQMGMLVVSLRGVNFGFWSRLGCSGQSAPPGMDIGLIRFCDFIDLDSMRGVNRSTDRQIW